MSPPRRRSSRIRSNNGTPYKPTKATMKHLAMLEETAEDSRSHNAHSALKHIPSSPAIPSTPDTLGRIKPALEEMHPSKAQQSTKKPDAGEALGFSDIGEHQPSLLTTPSKIRVPSAAEFDFSFNKPSYTLGEVAQRMMAEVQEEAQKIKEKLAADRAKQIAKTGTDPFFNNRKIAQPKPKAGRYSDIHMAAFKKMDSIANHPSALRAQQAQPSKNIASSGNLKRTQSKANLADRDGNTPKPSVKPAADTICLVDDAPAKRARPEGVRDISYARPASRDGPSKIPTTPSIPRTTSFLQRLTTPTQSSLARKPSTNQFGSQIPRSPSKIMTPGLVKSSTTNSLSRLTKSESTHRFTDKMKSILRRTDKALHEHAESKTPEHKKPATASSIPSLVKSPTRPDINKELPSTPGKSLLPRSKSMKHVNFTPTTIMKDEAQTSPSPVKSGIPRSKTFNNLNGIAYPNLSSPAKADIKPMQETKLSPAPKSVSIEARGEDMISYPKLPQVSPEAPPTPTRGPSPSKLKPEAVPGVFTFTADHQIKFATPPRFGASPGQATIRAVRQSIFPSKDKHAALPGSFLGESSDKENSAAEIPAVPHGLSNKKRARAASPDEEPRVKKRKGMGLQAVEVSPAKIERELQAPKSLIPSPTKKKSGGLTMNRLRALATPKKRK